MNGIDFAEFEKKLEAKNFTSSQQGFLDQRRSLMNTLMREQFKKMDVHKDLAKAASLNDDIFAVTPGTLTVVDLTDPMIDIGTACTLFEMCMAIFKEKTKDYSKIIALDEAHKVMSTKRYSHRPNTD